VGLFWDFVPLSYFCNAQTTQVMVYFVTQLLFACHNVLAPKSSCEFEKPDSEDAIDHFHVVA
jgi:hypothetical protein